MSGIRRASGQLLLIALLLSGCASVSGTGGSTLECDRTGQPDGAEDVGLGEGPAEQGYLLHGKAFTGVEVDDMVAVTGLRVTVAGDGFSTVLCSDGDGKWGEFFESPPPYTVTVDADSIPEGLRLRAPVVDDTSSFVVDEQTVYPVTVPLNFESDGEVVDSDAESGDSSAEAGVCSKYMQDLLKNPTLTSAVEISPTDAVSRVGFALPTPDCAVETEDRVARALYFGWEGDTDFASVSDALTAGGLAELDRAEFSDGRRFVYSPPDGEEGHLLYNGGRIAPGVPADHVMLVYVEELYG